MDKCRESFEQLPEIKDSLSENIVFVVNKYTTANEGFYDLVNWLNGGWYTWQSRRAELDQAYEDIETFAQAHQRECGIKVQIANELKEKDKRIESQSNCIENLVIQKSDYLDKVTKAIAHLDSFDHSKASINKLQRSIECALEALRGEHEA
ncbi:hypothetical protein [Acinetobacter sp.]|uniref:hypothetical protein n=1 Tax=Acinetobacter sp. TaxID=472 RepID=UPI003981DFB7